MKHLSGRSDAEDPWSRLSRLSDEALMAEIVIGSHDALTVLFDRFSRLVFTIADRILHDDGESEEVVQTVLLDVFRHARKFDPEKGTVKVWLIHCAYNQSLQRRRHLQARRFYQTEEFDTVMDEIVKHAPRTAHGLSAQETGRLVREALELLKEHQREAIQRTFFDGMTPTEISELTGIPVAHVRHNLYRGLSKLRQYLEKEYSLQQPAEEKEQSGFREEGGIADVRA